MWGQSDGGATDNVMGDNDGVRVSVGAVGVQGCSDGGEFEGTQPVRVATSMVTSMMMNILI